MDKLIWKSKKLFRKSFHLGSGKDTKSKVKMFTYSLLIGSALLLTMLFALSGNPFSSFSDALKNFSEYKTNKDRFLVMVATLGLAGVAVAIGFKTGLFNIGVSGQMMFGGLLAGMFALQFKDSIPGGLGQLMVFIIAVFGGMSLALISGAMKTFFGIHEVVSTIILNWIAFLLMQAVIPHYLPAGTYDKSHLTSIDFSKNFMFTYKSGLNHLGGLVAIGMLLVVALASWIVLFKTSFGKKMIIVGHNKDAALASGINVRVISMSSMAFSGAVAGALGVIVYFISKGSLPVSKVDAIPAEGFNGIAIALMAFSNPAAIIPVAIVFGAIQTLIVNTSTIDPTFVPVITGVFMMITALNIIFKQWNVVKLAQRTYTHHKLMELKKLHREKLEDIHEMIYEKYAVIMATFKEDKAAQKNPLIELKEMRDSKVEGLLEEHKKLISKEKDAFKKGYEKNKLLVPVNKEIYKASKEEIATSRKSEAITEEEAVARLHEIKRGYRELEFRKVGE